MKSRNRQYEPFVPVDKRWCIVHTMPLNPDAHVYDDWGWDYPVSTANKTLERYQSQLEAKRKRKKHAA